MNYTISQLLKYGNEPFEVNETVDFTKVAEQHHEIRKISKVNITGTGQISNKMIIFNLKITCDVTLPCAVTLVDVVYPLNIDTKEFFSFDEYAKEEDFEEDVTIVKGQKVELAPIVWQNIVVHIPLRVVSKDAYERIEKSGDNFEIIDEKNKEDQIDPRFAKLKDLLNK